VNEALTPPNLTAVVPLKSSPEMITVAPTGPVAGEKDTMVGAHGTTVKFVALVPVPPGPVTEIGPVVAPTGMTAVMRVADTTVKVVESPLTVTPVAPVNPVPVRVTVLRTHPLEGENEVMAGAGGVTVKLPALVPVPETVVTEMDPVAAVAGTVAVICVAELTVKVAVVPPKLTDDAPVKLVPVMTTDVPGGPLVGANPLIVGAGWVVTLKLVVLVTTP
jgi:hypothetical protein